jgi:glycosyltransferase involved in cell wall biosynthesis
MLTTLHWRVDIREFQDLYHYFNKAPLVAISHSQKAFIPYANVVSVVHHGLPVEEYPFNEDGGDYLAFVGRFSPEKGVHIALEASRKLGIPIKIGARMPNNDVDREYYKTKVKPLMDSSLVEYVGELGDNGKQELLKNAKATVIPTSWPEPFGLVTIESLCCGTPVIAYPLGGTKEIVKEGEVGYAVENISEIVEAVKKIDKIDRSYCRSYVEKNFSSSRMADNYEKVYRKLVK